MVRIQPFSAIRPLPNLAARVDALPYDVVTTAEARQLAAGNPYSFLHVSRAEIDLPPKTPPYDDAVYTAAARNLKRLLDEGILLREREPRMYIYRLVREGRSQVGVACCCHVDDYAAGAIRRHELTRRDKEDDRTRHILAVRAHTGPAILAFRDDPAFGELVTRDVNARPLFHFNAVDGVTHTVWTIEDHEPYRRLFGGVDRIYIADGHHRIASALRVAAERRAAKPRATGHQEHNWFLGVIFPAGELSILAYNRVVTDLGGRTPAAVLRELARLGSLAATDRPAPDRPGVLCVYAAGAWHRLELDPASIDRTDPVRSIDAALLQERVLGPILGITDERGDPRLEFVGGIRGTQELERRVNGGSAAIAFSLHPTSIEQLLAVADAGLIMPPKSTWFEPKLRSGLLVHEI